MMRKLLFLFLIFLTQSIFAKSLIIYPKESKTLELKNYLAQKYHIKGQNIFSKAELKGLALNSLAFRAIKINIDSDQLKKIKKDKYLDDLTIKIETNHKIISNSSNEYQHLQWAIQNDGRPKKVMLSDIEQINISSILGEDIQIKNTNEKQRVIKVAVIDSGIDLEHPDLINKIYTKPSECKALSEYRKCLDTEEDTNLCESKWAQFDSDNNGYAMDCQGWNVAAPINKITQIQGNQDTQDLIGHGTHVSGIIAAEDNQVGIMGVIQNVKIIPVKVSGSEEEYEEENSTDIFAKGLLYAIKAKADVINLSVGWASNEDSLLVSEMMNLAHQNNILIVVAAGNSAHSEISYPCAYHEVICVGAHLPNGEIAHFSNRGASVDILAPGFNILSTWPKELRPKIFVSRHGYEYKNGTSFAAPYVTGVLARLINQGFGPIQAKVALLKGTRPKIDQQELNSINGNLDYKTALSQKLNSFIYPFKKTPALINWDKPKKKMVVRLKNYLKEAKDIEITLKSTRPQIKVLNQQIKLDTWQENEIKNFEFFLESSEDIDSDLKFTIYIKSNDENKNYPIQGTALTIIHSDFSRSDSESYFVKSKAPLETMSFKNFKNIDSYKTHDFLVIDSTQKMLRFALMKDFGQEYKLSRFIETPFPENYLAHLAKLDIDQDGLEDYVVIGFIKDEERDDGWITKFLVYDHNFRPKDYLIAPENEFNNILTTINTGLIWTKQGDIKVPTWISSGYCPAEDLKKTSPWDQSVKNSWQKRVYFLSKNRLHCLNIDTLINDGKEYIAHSFFKQNNQQLTDGKATILFSEKISFKKDYLIADIDQLNNYQVLTISPYRNISNLNAIFGKSSNELFFTEIVRDNTTAEVTLVNSTNLSITQDEYFYQNVFDPIQMLISYNENKSWALTKYNLLYLNGSSVKKAESRNTDYQIQYKKLQKSEGIYLPSNHSPGYSSELINLKSNGEIYRSSYFRFLAYESCLEIDFIKSHWQQKDKVVFYCSDKRKLIIIDLTKGLNTPLLKMTQRLQNHKEEL